MVNKQISEQEVKRRFGNRMKDLRKKKGLSQEKLALDIEMDLTSVNEIEKGHRSLKLITIYKIANSLGVKLRDLADF